MGRTPKTIPEPIVDSQKALPKKRLDKISAAPKAKVHPKMEHKQSAAEMRVMARRTEVAKLRVQGLSIRAIGDRLGVSHEQAREDVAYCLADLENRFNESIEVLRLYELENTSAAIKRARDVMADSGDDEIALKAIDRLIKASDHRAKLLGLYAPTQLNQNHTVSKSLADAMGLTDPNDPLA